MNKPTTEEKIIYEWQYRMMGGFYTSLMKTISSADEINLSRLSRAFPEHVSAYRKYIGEHGWWQDARRNVNNYLTTAPMVQDDPDNNLITLTPENTTVNPKTILPDTPTTKLINRASPKSISSVSRLSPMLPTLNMFD